jgi:pantoate--beta-alanine ligase
MKKEPAVIKGASEWKALCADLRKRGKLGFVPTMGALHEGHASLVRRSAAECAATVVSVFVNPAQFNDPKDLMAYPRAFDADVALLGEAGADAVFFPEPATVYPDGYRYRMTESDLSLRYCGAHRPGHFDGVLTVVMKLLMLTRPDRSYFGEKDYQQYLLIRGMAEDFFLDSEIVPCPIVREASGLAMSSRNARLSPEGKEKAALIHRALEEGGDAAAVRDFLDGNGFKTEYVEDLVDPYTGNIRRLAAAWLEGVRLIDNACSGGKGDKA